MYLYRRPTKEDFLRQYDQDGLLYTTIDPATGLEVETPKTDRDAYVAALADYEKCKGYILDYQKYPMSAAEPNEQPPRVRMLAALPI